MRRIRPQGADVHRLVERGGLPIGWIRGAAIRIGAFPTERDAIAAALRGARAPDDELRGGDGAADARVEPHASDGGAPPGVRLAHDGAYEWIVVGRRPLARPIRPRAPRLADGAAHAFLLGDHAARPIGSVRERVVRFTGYARHPPTSHAPRHPRRRRSAITPKEDPMSTRNRLPRHSLPPPSASLVLLDGDVLAAWIRGRAVGFGGFPDEGAAADAALVAYVALSCWADRHGYAPPLPARSLATSGPDGRDGASHASGRHHGFELEVPVPAGEPGIRRAAYAVYRALCRSGLAWRHRDTDRARAGPASGGDVPPGVVEHEVGFEVDAALGDVQRRRHPPVSGATAPKRRG